MQYLYIGFKYFYLFFIHIFFFQFHIYHRKVILVFFFYFLCLYLLYCYWFLVVLGSLKNVYIYSLNISLLNYNKMKTFDKYQKLSLFLRQNTFRSILNNVNQPEPHVYRIVSDSIGSIGYCCFQVIILIIKQKLNKVILLHN